MTKFERREIIDQAAVPLIRAEQLVKTYRAGAVEVAAIKGVDFTIEAKSFVTFVGPSGSGKTTLLNMIGCLDHPTSGRIAVLDTDVTGLDRRAAAEFRGKHIGFVFPGLQPDPGAHRLRERRVPADHGAGLAGAQASQAGHAAARSGRHEGQENKRPDQISGGQKQRVAVARALATDAQLVLADEPTANLDHDTAYRIIELMKKMRDELGTTFLFSTHDPKIMSEAVDMPYATPPDPSPPAQAALAWT